MASVDITISGILYNKNDRTGTPVTLVGEAILTGLGVGGGPIYPPEGGGGGGGKPPGIWGGPIDPYPGHPLPNPPPGTWPGPRPPHPAHPIVLPTPPTEPPPVDPPTNPPDPAWEWGWNPSVGWVPVFVAGDKPQPPH